MRKLFVVAICVALSFSAQAEEAAKERDFAEIYLECGIGGLLFQKESLGWAAVISNIIWDLGITASSSQITSPESCKGGKPTVAALIYQTYPVVERELSEGRGDYISAVMDLSGCSADARPEIIQSLRSDMSAWVQTEAYATADRYHKAEFLHNQLSKSVEASASCSFI